MQWILFHYSNFLFLFEKKMCRSKNRKKKETKQTKKKWWETVKDRFGGCQRNMWKSMGGYWNAGNARRPIHHEKFELMIWVVSHTTSSNGE